MSTIEPPKAGDPKPLFRTALQPLSLNRFQVRHIAPHLASLGDPQLKTARPSETSFLFFSI